MFAAIYRIKPHFEVEDWHTYFVSENNVLVHNTCEILYFNSFEAFKKALGSAGKNKAWHHIVEQSQIQKSGFKPTQIHNTHNVIAIDQSVHVKISAYYSSKQDFSEGLRVRDWLAGQSYETQYEFGEKILEKFGVIR